MKRLRFGKAMRVAGCVLAASALIAAKAPRTADALSTARIEAALRAHIETLASDDFGGRLPGTDGETRTLRYLARQWFDIGLESGTNDPGNPWFAPVAMVERVPVASRATFMRGKRRIAVPEGAAFVVTSGVRGLVNNAPVLFVGSGNGPVPPRAELAGRVAMMLDGQVGAKAGLSLAERQGRLLDGGAAAVLTLLDGGHSIPDLRARRAKAGYALANGRSDGDLEAFITPAFAATLLAGSPFASVASLEAEAGKAGFVPHLMPFTVSLEATSRETRILTHNLIARLPGRKPQDGAVMVVAHWDHLGKCGDPAGDAICNGAVDNASGLAVITEVARILARGKPLDRDVYFLATTGEEMGMLGAQAFTENPPLPLDRIVAALNVDSDAIAPAGGAFGIVGKGMTGLDPGIEKVASEMNRKIAGDDDANSYVRRQDIWAFMQHDVPSVMVSTAFGDDKRLKRFMEKHYHKPNDEYRPEMELGGAVDDVRMMVALVREFADPARWPMPGQATH